MLELLALAMLVGVAALVIGAIGLVASVVRLVFWLIFLPLRLAFRLLLLPFYLLKFLLVGVVGLIAAPISLSVMRLRTRRGLDESLDVFACHGMGGLWGALATGLFATKAVNPAGADGLFYGNPSQLVTQAIAAGIVVVFSFAVSFVLAKALNAAMGLRVTPNEEEVGLDISEHGEQAYA